MLIGAISGDIAGSSHEWDPVQTYDFELFTSKNHFTDDTVMTLAVASWLLKDRTLDTLIKEMQFFGNRYPHAGYGGNFVKWLQQDYPDPYNSFGNGSAMRVSPCGWVANSLEEAESLAKQSAIVSHNHSEGVKGAQSVASAIYLARIGETKQNIKSYIMNTYKYDLDRTINDIKKLGYKFDVTCQGSVPEAIIAFLESDNFESTLRNAVYLGGDSDTQAAIAGSIAEAFYKPTNYDFVAYEYLDNFLLSVYNKFNNTFE